MAAVLENATRAVFSNASWGLYTQLREELSHSTDITFDHGRLEIRSAHRYDSSCDVCLLSMLIDLFLIESEMRFLSSGRLTLASPLAERAAEPDNSYYISHTPPPPGTRNIDLAVHDAPDLVIEIDLTSHSVDKEPICAAFGVLEVWRWEEQHLRVRRLNEQRTGYADAPESGLLPDLPIDALAEQLRRGMTEPHHDAIFRDWRQAIGQR